jgi:hypothetical protein
MCSALVHSLFISSIAPKQPDLGGSLALAFTDLSRPVNARANTHHSARIGAMQE